MNRVTSPLRAALLLTCTLAALPAAAERREHGSHVHGTSYMDVVLDDKMLAIDLNSPAANLLGFEHAPRDKTEEAVLAQAVTRLRDADAIFTLPQAARCKIEAVEVKSALLEHEHDEAHEVHSHHDGDKHEGEKMPAHTDMMVSYRFHCAKPGAIDGITANLFKLFPATEEIEVQHITPNGQGAAELTADAPRLRF